MVHKLSLSGHSAAAFFLFVACLASMPVSAATVSYFLNLSNALPDGTNYLKVTISDSTTSLGDIDFRVDVIGDSFPAAGGNFGMDKFLFNYDAGLSVTACNITDINAGWRINSDKNAGGGFDRYAFELKGSGATRTNLLTFTISGVSGDTPFSYATGADYLHNGSTEFFAAHVGSFDAYPYGTSSAWLAGSTAVPVPAALWLLGSGLIGLVAVARRRQR